MWPKITGLVIFFFFKNWEHKYFLWYHWYSCSALLVMFHVSCSLKFTSGATPADLLMASMAADQISSTYLQAGIGEGQNHDLSCHRWMLNRLSYAGFINWFDLVIKFIIDNFRQTKNYVHFQLIIIFVYFHSGRVRQLRFTKRIQNHQNFLRTLLICVKHYLAYEYCLFNIYEGFITWK